MVNFKLESIQTDMEKVDLKLLKEIALEEIKKANSPEELGEVFNKYLGKQGELVSVLRSLVNLSKEEKVRIGKEANEVKNILRIEFEKKEKELKEAKKRESEEKEWLDVTIPGKKPKIGHLHPLTLVRRKIEEIFQGMGFSVADGPEIETDFYNFEALNIPKDHPARDMWDTFWVKPNIKSSAYASPSRNASDEHSKASSFAKASEDGSAGKQKLKLLLRTHTSPVQIRFMEKNNPPLRIIIPGRIFRHEATDASHDFQFHHIEGLMVGRDISVANFKGIMQEFFSSFFGKKIDLRLRPSYFPFTEPSFEIDTTCVVCGGKGCSVCKEAGWLEMMGCGMVHPNVYKNSGLKEEGLTGFAFGMGWDRLTMMMYKINEIRLLQSGDLRFLSQF